MQTSEFYIK